MNKLLVLLILSIGEVSGYAGPPPKVVKFEGGGEMEARYSESQTSLCYDADCTKFSRLMGGYPHEHNPWKEMSMVQRRSHSYVDWTEFVNVADANGKQYAYTSSIQKEYNLAENDVITTSVHNITVSSTDAVIPFTESATKTMTPGTIWRSTRLSNYQFQNELSFVRVLFFVELYDEHGNATDVVKTEMSNGASRYSVGGAAYFELYGVMIGGVLSTNYDMHVQQRTEKHKVEFQIDIPYFQGEVNLHAVLGDTKLTETIAATGYVAPSGSSGEINANFHANRKQLDINDTVFAYYKNVDALKMECCFTQDCTSASTVSPGHIVQTDPVILRSSALNLSTPVVVPWSSPVTRQDKNGVDYTEVSTSYTFLQNGTHDVQLAVYLRGIQSNTTLDLGGKEYHFSKQSFVYEYIYDGNMKLSSAASYLDMRFEVFSTHINMPSFIHVAPNTTTAQGAARLNFDGPLYYDVFPYIPDNAATDNTKLSTFGFGNSLSFLHTLHNPVSAGRFIFAVGVKPSLLSDDAPTTTSSPATSANSNSGSSSASNDVLQDDGLKPDEESSNATGTVLIILAVLAILVAGGYYKHRKTTQSTTKQQDDLKKPDCVAPASTSGKVNETAIQEAVVNTE